MNAVFFYLFAEPKPTEWHGVDSTDYLTNKCSIRLCRGQSYLITAYARSSYGLSENTTLVVSNLNGKIQAHQHV